MRRAKRYKTNNYNNGNIVLKHIIKNKKVYILSTIIILIILMLISPIIWYKTSITAINKNDNSEQIFEIKEGETGKIIGEKLEKQKIIKSKKAFKIYTNLNKKKVFVKGVYSLKKSQDLKDIIQMFENGKIKKQKVKIQIIEGKTIDDLALIISQTTKNTKEDVYAKLKDQEYLRRVSQKYPFIDYNVVSDSNIRYSLEGYLFPDTYIYENPEVNVEQIFEKMLDEMGKKLVTYNQNSLSRKQNLTIHQLLTLASIIEKEAGPSNNANNLQSQKTERQIVAQIFMNRLYKKMSLGSDVTTYYGLGLKLSDRDLTRQELNASNPYNTRGAGMAGKLPVGPIGFSSLESINAAIEISNNYIPSEELFFVSDKNGKIYTAKTNEEHEEIIRRLKSANLWYEYN